MADVGTGSAPGTGAGTPPESATPRTLDDLSAQEIIAHLGLEPLDGEGCWWALLHRSDAGNAIYALVTPQEFSALHLLAEDELWVHVAGEPVDLLVLHPDGRGERVLLGDGVAMTRADTVTSPAHLVPAGAWQGASVARGWGLVVCALAPPFSGFQLASRDDDFSAWPAHAARIAELIRG